MNWELILRSENLTDAFMPWFFYEWLPSSRDTAIKRQAHGGQAYLDNKGQQLDMLLAAAWRARHKATMMQSPQAAA